MEIFISTLVPTPCLDLNLVAPGHREFLWWDLLEQRVQQALRDSKDLKVYKGLKDLQEFWQADLLRAIRLTGMGVAG